MNMQSLRSAIRLEHPSLTPLRPLQTQVSWLRRAAFIGPVAAVTVSGTALVTVLTAGVSDVLRWPLLALIAANLFYLALVGWPGILGFIVHASGRGLRTSGVATGLSRTALLMPIHNEDPRAVFTAIETMVRAMADAKLPNVETFILSDSQDPAVAAAEAEAFAAIQARLPLQGPAVHYRRRTSNAGRKVGNLGEFCAVHGERYDYMMVLDADSLMGAGTIARLIGLMDANPTTGMIQTVPYPVGRDTLFARIQQFSARLYTPLLVEGLTFWQQGEGNYWGHNAIVRIAPFMEHCTLPVLPGHEPWGGEILCHDVVEAGLMRGAGWQCWVLPEVMESYEALPANIVDYASRERRWCQGNLQHIGLLRHPGLRTVGRFHLGYGVMHYIAAPLVIALMALATVDTAMSGGTVPALLGGSGLAHTALAALLLGILYGGKLLSLGAALADPDEAQSYGGRARLLLSAAAEQVAALVISAVLIVLYARYVTELVRGRTVRWDSQPRDNRGVSWREGWLRFRGATVLGAVWLAMIILAGGPGRVALLGWVAPLLFGLLMSVPSVIWSSRIGLGERARRAGLFQTPEETAPATIIRQYQRTMGVAPMVPASLGLPVGAGLHLATSAVGD